METVYKPHKRRSLLILIALSAVIIGLSAYLLAIVSLNPVAQGNFMRVLGAVFLVGALLFLLYQGYVVATTEYSIARAGLILRWGLRREIIPMSAIDWVRPVSDFQSKLPLPFFRLPGVYYRRKLVNGLGNVEFVGTEPSQFVLVSARGRFFVISPKDVDAFSKHFQRLTELGALESYPVSSQGFGTLWKQVWTDKKAKYVMVFGLLAALLLLALATLLSTIKATITWVSLDVVSSQRLFLLAVLGIAIWISDLWIGFVLYVWSETEKILIYFLWGASIFCSLILAVAMLIMSL